MAKYREGSAREEATESAAVERAEQSATLKTGPHASGPTGRPGPGPDMPDHPNIGTHGQPRHSADNATKGQPKHPAER